MFSRDEMQRAIEDALKTMEGVALELYRRGREPLLEELEAVKRERDEARASCPDCAMWAERSARWHEDMQRAERERDEARAEVEKLSESAKTAWEAECVMREQRDRYHAEWKQERQEVERLRRMLPVHPSSLTDACTDAYRRGAEAMREACAEWISKHNGVSKWVYDDMLSDLSIPEEP